MAQKPKLTERGLLSESFGRRPYVVTLREEKAPGTNVILDYTAPGGGRRKPTLGYAVRRPYGRGWKWNVAVLERARERAEDKSAELRLNKMREEVLEPAVVTFGQAVALYCDPKSGGLPRLAQTQTAYQRHLRAWSGALGADTPWGRITPAKVMGRARELEDAGRVSLALAEARTLRVLVRWLRGPAQVKGIQDIMLGFPWKRLTDKHQPKQPRYPREQLAEIVKVRHDVDPRFALYMSLMDDSGARSKAVRTLMRSMVNTPLDLPPTEEEAPFGWILFPALKGQRNPLHLLTAFERRELDLALSGYLHELEFMWTQEQMDYPLFPGVRLRDRHGLVVDVAQPRAYQPVGPSAFYTWLHDAEKRAGIKRRAGLGWHGVRRTVSDLLYEEMGIDGLTTAMAWSSRVTPEKIYVDRRRMPDRVRAREAMEKKRGPKDGPEA